MIGVIEASFAMVYLKSGPSGAFGRYRGGGKVMQDAAGLGELLAVHGFRLVEEEPDANDPGYVDMNWRFEREDVADREELDRIVHNNQLNRQPLDIRWGLVETPLGEVAEWAFS